MEVESQDDDPVSISLPEAMDFSLSAGMYLPSLVFFAGNCGVWPVAISFIGMGPTNWRAVLTELAKLG